MKVVVIGGGAAGFFGAITCAETYPDAQVTLLEAGREVLTKVRISGGGRCNVTHACFDPALLIHQYPRGGKALRGAFTRFQPRDTIQWFEQRGVSLKTESDGRLFPTTDQSATIIQALTQAAKQAGVNIWTDSTVENLQVNPNQIPAFQIQLKRGSWLQAHRVLLATGSHRQGYRLAQALGHQIESPVPSLFTFNISDPNLTELAGISVNAVQLKLKVKDWKLDQSGSLLITHWGLSGPAVLRLSAWGARPLHKAQYQAQLDVNWVPQSSQAALRDCLNHQRTQAARRHLGSQNPLALPQRLWRYLISCSDLDPETRWSDLSKSAVSILIKTLTQSEFEISGKGIFKDEFVTCGGVNLKDVNFKSMESRQCPGLFFAGEILDIDGITGGFNFQNAWTTAWIAGQAMGVSS